MGLFIKFETFFASKFTTLLSSYISIFSSKTIFLFQLGIPILILYYGYSIMMPGGSRATLQEMMFNFVRIALVFTFVQNTDNLLRLSIDFVQELKTGFIEEKSLFALLDEQISTTQKLSQIVFKLDTAMVPMRGALASLMIWLGAIFMLASSAIVFIAAEVGLALLMVTSPIFIGCLTYSFTRELFNGWLRSIFSCIITLIFATLVVRMGIDANSDVIHKLLVSPSQDSLMTIGAICCLTGIIISSLVLVATKLAGNIAGVAATSSIQGGMMLGTKAGFVGTSTPTAAVAGATIKYAGKKIGPLRSHFNKSFTGHKSQHETGSTIKEQSQQSSFSRVQQENSQD